MLPLRSYKILVVCENCYEDFVKKFLSTEPVYDVPNVLFQE